MNKKVVSLDEIVNQFCHRIFEKILEQRDSRGLKGCQRSAIIFAGGRDDINPEALQQLLITAKQKGCDVDFEGDDIIFELEGAHFKLPDIFYKKV